MLSPGNKMAVVFVIARDWTLRTAVHAELRESGIDALGMESAEAAGRAIASGQMPQAVVLEAAAEIAADAAVQTLISRVPTVLIASRMEKIPLPPASIAGAAEVFYRPLRIADIVSCVRQILDRGAFA
jgi:DNA-binding NtrC family response regulator